MNLLARSGFELLDKFIAEISTTRTNISRDAVELEINKILSQKEIALKRLDSDLQQKLTEGQLSHSVLHALLRTIAYTDRLRRGPHQFHRHGGWHPGGRTSEGTYHKNRNTQSGTGYVDYRELLKENRRKLSDALKDAKTFRTQKSRAFIVGILVGVITIGIIVVAGAVVAMTITRVWG